MPSQVSKHIVFELKFLVAKRTGIFVRCIVLVHVMLQKMSAFECFHTDLTCMVIVMR